MSNKITCDPLSNETLFSSSLNALKTLCKCLYEDEKENGGKLPYGYMKTFIKENKKTWEWMTRDTVMLVTYRIFKLKLEAQMAKMDSELSKSAAEDKVISSGVSVTLSDLAGDNIARSKTSLHDLDRSKGGRPVATTINRKRLEKDVILEAKNEITLKYRVSTDAAREKNKNVKRGYLSASTP